MVDGTSVYEVIVVGEDCIGLYFASGTRSASGHAKWRTSVFVAHCVEMTGRYQAPSGPMSMEGRTVILPPFTANHL